MKKLILSLLILGLSYGLVDSSLTDFRLIKAGKGIYGEGTNGLGIQVIGLSVNNTIIIDKDAKGAILNGTLKGPSATITNLNTTLLTATTVTANNYKVSTAITYSDGTVQNTAFAGTAVDNLVGSKNVTIQSDSLDAGTYSVTIKDGNTTAMQLSHGLVDVPVTLNTSIITARSGSGLLLKAASGDILASFGAGNTTVTSLNGSVFMTGHMAIEKSLIDGDAALEVGDNDNHPHIIDGYNQAGTEIFSFSKIGGLWVSKNVTANAFIGDGSALTNLPSVPTSNFSGTANYSVLSGTASTSNYSITGNYANLSNTANIVPWSGITSKPTTLVGYGITDKILTNNYFGNITLNGTVVQIGNSNISGNWTLGNISGNTTFASSGFMSMTGNSMPWDDVRIDTLTARSGVSAPTLTGGFAGNANMYYNSFSGTQQNDVYFAVELPHGWAIGTNISPHVHVSPATSLTGTISFIVEYTLADINGTFGASQTATMNIVVASPSQWKHILIDSISDIVSPFTAISGVMYCHLYRDITVAGNMTGAVALKFFDIHYRSDALGSRTEFAK